MLLLRSLGCAVLGAAAGLAAGALFARLFAGADCCGLEGLEPLITGFTAGGVAGFVVPVVSRAVRGSGERVAGVAVLIAPAMLAIWYGIGHAWDLYPDAVVSGIVSGIAFALTLGAAAAGARRTPRRFTVLVALIAAGVLIGVSVGVVFGDTSRTGPVSVGEGAFSYVAGASGDALELSVFMYLTLVVPVALWPLMPARGRGASEETDA